MTTTLYMAPLSADFYINIIVCSPSSFPRLFAGKYISPYRAGRFIRIGLHTSTRTAYTSTEMQDLFVHDLVWGGTDMDYVLKGVVNG